MNPDQDPFEFIGRTRGLLAEFEQTMKIFDDFAFSKISQIK